MLLFKGEQGQPVSENCLKCKCHCKFIYVLTTGADISSNYQPGNRKVTRQEVFST